MKAIFRSQGVLLNAELHTTPKGLVAKGDTKNHPWLNNLIRKKPPEMTDEEYLEYLMMRHGALTAELFDDNDEDGK